MDNFEKQLATFITDEAGGNFLLGDEQRTNILQFMSNRIDYIALYGSMLDVQVDKGSTTIIKDVKDGGLTKKGKGIGDGGGYVKPKLGSKTVAFAEESNIGPKIGFTNRDKALGLDGVKAKKLARNLFTHFKARQRLFFTELLDVIAKDIEAKEETTKIYKLPYPIDTETKARYVWNLLALAGEEHIGHIDDKQGIDELEESWRFVDSVPYLVGALSQLGFNGGQSKEAVAGGSFVMTEIAGVNGFRKNPYIKRLKYNDGAGQIGGTDFPVAGIMTTKFKAKFPYKLLKAHVSTFDASAEEVVYTEDLYGKDVSRNKDDSPTIVYEGLTTLFVFDKTLDITNPPAGNIPVQHV